jgi:hypothetical protein
MFTKVLKASQVKRELEEYHRAKAMLDGALERDGSSLQITSARSRFIRAAVLLADATVAALQ